MKRPLLLKTVVIGALVAGAIGAPASPVFADGTCTGTKTEIRVADYNNPELTAYDVNGDGIICTWTTRSHKHKATFYSDNKLP